jgi:hypothetical protein
MAMNEMHHLEKPLRFSFLIFSPLFFQFHSVAQETNLKQETLDERILQY